MTRTSVKISSQLSYKLTVANVVLTILIVWSHVSANYSVPPILSNIGGISVPCFFAISSFLYFISFDFSNIWKTYKIKLYKRFKSLIIPLIIFCLIGLAIKLLLYQVHPVEHHPLEGVTALNFPKYVYEGRFNGPLWYLRALFEFVLFAPILGIIIRTTPYSALLIIPLYFIGKELSYFSFLYWMCDIFTGAYIALYFDKIKSIYINLNSYLKYGGMIISVLTLIMTCADAYLFRCVLPLCFSIIISPIHFKSNKCIVYLAGYSMLLYCLHIPVSRFTSKVPSFIGIDSPTGSLIIATILTILVIMLIGGLIKKNERLWRFLSGGR